MPLAPETLTILVYVSLGLSALLLVLLALRSGRRPASSTARPVDSADMVREVLESHGRSLTRLESTVRQLASQDRSLDRRVDGTVQLVGLIRYDAFPEMGGRLSFSCALLDRHGDGVVITSINGRQDTRVYAKPVRDAGSSHNLSEEEEQAIQQALAGPREAVKAT
jgi:Protein of unknown function (DUF4446)